LQEDSTASGYVGRELARSRASVGRRIFIAGAIAQSRFRHYGFSTPGIENASIGHCRFSVNQTADWRTTVNCRLVCNQLTGVRSFTVNWQSVGFQSIGNRQSVNENASQSIGSQLSSAVRGFQSVSPRQWKPRQWIRQSTPNRGDWKCVNHIPAPMSVPSLSILCRKLRFH